MSFGVRRATHQVVNASLSFKGVRDPRRTRYVKHSMAGLLRMLVLTVAAGARRMRGVEDLGAMVCKGLLNKLGLSAAPSDTTYVELLARMGTGGLEDELHAYNKAAMASGAVGRGCFPVRLWVVDGKGGAKGLGEAPNKALKTTVYNAQHDKCWHLFQLRSVLVTPDACLCLGQTFLDDKQGEAKAFAPHLKHLKNIYGDVADVLSMDAGLNSAANAEAVLAAAMDYLFGIKQNAPKRLRHVKAALADCPVVATTVERAQGKQCTRTLRRAPAPSALEFPGATQVLHVTLEILDADGNAAVDARFFITSIPAGKLTDDELLALVRMHWGIENGSNWTADLVFEEDNHVMCSSGEAVLVLSWLRLLAMNITAIARAKLKKGKTRPSWQTTIWNVFVALTRCSCGTCEHLVLAV